MKGKIIVIEGGDGAGKETQSKLLISRLEAAGHEVATLDFPRYEENHFGRLLRECLDGGHGDFMAIDPQLKSVLYAADRFESKATLEAWLAAGKVVVLDRYTSGNMMHQSVHIEDESKLSAYLDWLHHMEHTVFGIPVPDLVVYLDVPHELRRALKQEAAAAGKHGGKEDQAERDQAHQRLAEQRAQHIAGMKDNWYRVVCCDSEGVLRTREDIHEEVFGQVIDLLHS